MYLAQLTIKNFRRLKDVKLEFQRGLNVLVGPNNVGKTAVVDALRALLAGHNEPYPAFDGDDRYRPKGGAPAGDIEFRYVFRDLSLDEQADFHNALVPESAEVHLSVRYSEVDKTRRLRAKRWFGHIEDSSLSVDMLENLRGVYLPALRDASQGLRPSRSSQLSRLFQLLVNDVGRAEILDVLIQFDEQIKQQEPVAETEKLIKDRHTAMLGDQFTQSLGLELTGSDFQRLAARLGLKVDDFDIEQNGLGFNNLVYMAVVLCELAKNPEASYRGLIIEEPEAHLHPQLQAVLMDYLKGKLHSDAEKPVQLFVTSHSPHFASLASLDSLVCLVEHGGVVEPFFPRKVKFEKGKREKLERYLDVTRAELFFARRIIFVEGAAELMLIGVLAKKCGFDLRKHGVSLISVEGLNFDSFLPLFGEKQLKIPVSVITDADPVGHNEKAEFPDLGDTPSLSSNLNSLKKYEDSFIMVAHGVKTFEYDLALQHASNCNIMLETLKELHPVISNGISTNINCASENINRAKELYCGMFERQKENHSAKNVKKGEYGQLLALNIASSDVNFIVPKYIEEAIRHVCEHKS